MVIKDIAECFDSQIRLQSQGVVVGSPIRYNGTIHCLVETIKKEKVVIAIRLFF